MGEDWPQFHELPHGVASKTQLIYVHRYINPNIYEPIDFQVVGGQLHIDLFAREAIRYFSFIVMELADYTSDGKHTSFSLMYYVDSLLIRN